MNEKSCVQLFVGYLKDNGKAALTIRNYERTLIELESFVVSSGGSLANLTRIDVKQYVKDAEKRGQAASTLHNKYAAISAFARFMNRPDVIEGVNLPEQRKVQHIAPKSLERNERNELLRKAERKGNIRDTAIVYTFLGAGLRVAELAALDRRDITLGERSGTLIVRNGKGNVSRRVPLSKEVRYHIQRYLDTREDDLEPLFISNYKQRISIRAVQHTLNGFGVHPHILRHSFGRQLVAGGTDISTVAELMGHADINVTRRYSKPTEADLANAVDRIFD